MDISATGFLMMLQETLSGQIRLSGMVYRKSLLTILVVIQERSSLIRFIVFLILGGVRAGKEGSYFTSLLPGSTGQPINVADLKSALTGQPATLQIIAEKCSDEWYKGYAKAYKQSDITGVPVSVNVATNILNQMRALNTETYTNSTENIKPIYGYSSGGVFQKAYGDPMSVHPVDDDTLVMMEIGLWTHRMLCLTKI